jgi:hypothetical protein
LIAVSDAVDDDLALELGEHAEHLDQHPPGRVEVSNGSVADRQWTLACSSSSIRTARSRMRRVNRSRR